MKALFVVGLLALGALAAHVETAQAFVCGAGPYRAGCAGPRGAVVTARPVAARCVYRAGVRVCR